MTVKQPKVKIFLSNLLDSGCGSFSRINFKRKITGAMAIKTNASISVLYNMFMDVVSSSDTKSPKTDQNWQKKMQKSLPWRILSYVGFYALLIMFIFGVYLGIRAVVDSGWLDKIGFRILTGKDYDEVSSEEYQENRRVMLDIDGKQIEVVRESKAIEKALRDKVREKNPVWVTLEDYGNFEKTGKLGFDLPTNDQELTAKSGDIMLYQGDQISIFYDENTWSYTKLGHIEMNEAELRALLGDGTVYARLWLE